MSLTKYHIIPGFVLFLSFLSFRIEMANDIHSISASIEKFDSHTGPSMNGLCWVAGDSIGDHNISQIVNLGANWISQTPFGWMDGHDSPIVVLNNHKAWWGEADRGIVHTACEAKIKGVQTMLKPHIWITNSNGKWRSDISMNSKEEWDQWFASYKDWIMHYARLAEKNEIEALCIGTELYITTRKHPDKWRDIIADIRKVYGGKLTYAANWYKEFEDIIFWDDLDYIGVQAYFPLTKNEKPSKQELLKSWEKYKKNLKMISDKFGKKVIFTEIGYKNTADAAIEPWKWPQKMEDDITVSDHTQRICYEALFESLWHEPWLEGFFIWKWFHTTHKYQDYDTYFVARRKRRKEWAIKRGWDLGPEVYFSPQRTEAIKVLKDWYQEKGNKE